MSSRIRSSVCLLCLFLLIAILPLSSSIQASAALSAPYDVVATVGNGQIHLTWNAPINDGGSHIVNYFIYRSTTSGGEAVMSPPIPFSYTTSYTDTNVMSGTTYYYQVAAINGVGQEGPISNEVSATASSSSSSSGSIPSAPTDVTASVSSGEIVISWNGPAYTGGSYCSYEVFRGTYPGGMSVLYDSLQGTYGNSFTDTTAQAGQQYYYYVVATNSNGQSVPSETVSATSPVVLPPNYYTSQSNNNSSLMIVALTVVVAIIAVVSLIFMIKRKKKRTPPAPSQYHPPVQPPE